MTNSEVQNLLECHKLPPPKFSAAPTARSCGRPCGRPGKRRGCCSPCRRRPAVPTPHRVRVVGGWAVSTLTYAFLSVRATAHKTWPILYAHSPNIMQEAAAALKSSTAMTRIVQAYFPRPRCPYPCSLSNASCATQGAAGASGSIRQLFGRNVPSWTTLGSPPENRYVWIASSKCSSGRTFTPYNGSSPNISQP